MRREISAGGVVWSRTLNKLLLIRDSYGRWALPKGLIEKDESAEAAALREVGEETGLKQLKAIERLGEIKYFYQLKGERIFKIVIFYLIEAADTALAPSWEVKGAEWFEPQRAIETIAYKNTAEIMRKAVARIKAHTS